MGPTPMLNRRGQRVDTAPSGAREGRRWAVFAAVEVALATAAVLFDLGLPTVVILALMVVSLLIRRQGLSTLGFHRVPHGWVLAAKMLAFAAAWTLVNIALLKPIQNHLTGTTQDMSQFASLKGNVTMLFAWLALSWTLAAVGETLALLGFVQTRITQVVGRTGAGPVGAVAIAVAVSSLLLGLLHTEYGIVGVMISAADGVFYSVLRYRYRTLWAAVLAHGFLNTIGFVSVFLIGPVHGLW